jgi:truncated hemoglobin YjbI
VYDKTPSMKDVHRRGLLRIGQSHPPIEQWHFARFVEHLAASLAAAGVADEITQEILTVLAPLADDIATGWGDGGGLTGV